MLTLLFFSLASFIINLFIWVHVFSIANRTKTGRVFLHLNGTLTLWTLCDFLLQLNISEIVELNLSNFCTLFWLPVGLFYYQFVLYFLRKDNRFILNIMFAAVTGTVLVHLLSNLINLGQIHTQWGYHTIKGPLFIPVVLITVIIPAFYTFYLLFREYLKTEDSIDKKQISLLLWGGALTFALSFATDIFPELIQMKREIPEIAHISSSILVIFCYLAIMNRHFYSLTASRTAGEIFSNMNDGVILINRKNIIVEINPAVENIFDIKKEIYAGRSAEELPGVIDLENDIQEIEYIIDNREKILQITNSDFIKKDVYLGKIILVQDITEQRIFEKDLLKQKDKLENIVEVKNQELQNVDRSLKEINVLFAQAFENTSFGMGIIDGETYKLIQINKLFCKILGYENKEIIGKNIVELGIYRKNDIYTPIFKQLENDGLIHGLEQLFIDKNHKAKWLLLNIDKFTLLNKTYYLIVLSDITEKKNASIELLESKTTTEAILDTTPIGISIVKNRIFGWSNKITQEILGYDYKELEGMETVLLYESQDEYRRVEKELTKQLNSNRAGVISTKWKNKSGEIIDVLLRVKPIVLPDGEKSFITIIENITNKLKIEEKLLEAQKMDSIGNLAGGVAHDFNNMLGGILGYSSIMLRKEKDPEKLEYLSKIISAAERSSDLTQKLLAFGRRGMNLQQSIDINDNVREVVDLLERSMDKRVTINVNLKENCHSINADPTQINQVVMNLALNAYESIPGTGEINIQTDNEYLDEVFCSQYPNLKSGEFTSLKITDNGIGIDSETRKRIFEPFFTTKREGQVQGTGLGLATTYGIIHNHKGIIIVNSKVKEGSSFKVYFPKTNKNNFDEGEFSTESFETGKGNILIIEDEEILQEMLEMILTSLGYKVISAFNGQDAIDIYEKQHDEIDGVLLDLQMPVMDGRETFEKLKSINPDVKVLLSTGYGCNKLAQEILDNGALGLLEKPYQFEKLSQKVKEVIGD